MSLRYLVDENVDVVRLAGLRHRRPDLMVWAVGEPGAPPRGTPDPALLAWCEEHDVILLTNNRRTMPAHLAAHVRDGRHCPGIFLLKAGLALGETLDFLVLAADASRPAEHQDQIRFLPL